MQWEPGFVLSGVACRRALGTSQESNAPRVRNRQHLDARVALTTVTCYRWVLFHLHSRRPEHSRTPGKSQILKHYEIDSQTLSRSNDNAFLRFSSKTPRKRESLVSNERANRKAPRSCSYLQGFFPPSKKVLCGVALLFSLVRFPDWVMDDAANQLSRMAIKLANWHLLFSRRMVHCAPLINLAIGARRRIRSNSLLV